MGKKYDPEAELKKVGKKLRKQQREDTDRFIKDLEKEGAKEDAKKSRRDP